MKSLLAHTAMLLVLAAGCGPRTPQDRVTSVPEDDPAHERGHREGCGRPSRHSSPP